MPLSRHEILTNDLKTLSPRINRNSPRWPFLAMAREVIAAGKEAAKDKDTHHAHLRYNHAADILRFLGLRNH